MSIAIHYRESIRDNMAVDAVFEEVYTRYWSTLYAIAYNRLQSKEAAEDVVQEVMLGFFQRKKEEAIHNIEAWLATATRYAVFRQMGKSAKQLTSPIAPHQDRGYHQDFDSRFINDMLQRQIDQLPEKCKLVFNYSRNHELSNKEIAGKLDISEKAVEKHITKAISRLRERLRKSLSSFFF